MGVEKSEKTLNSLLQDCPKDSTIVDNLIRAWAKINSPLYSKIVCTISGGADSDIVLDICTKCDKDNKIDYVWFDTGLEYQATKNHLQELEEKYRIEIKPYRSQKPIPLACKEHGQPFISKRVSDYISRLQRHGFGWENEDFDILIRKYCKWSKKRGKWVGCYTALKWWCNKHSSSQFNISQNNYLKEFIIENNPQFKISDKCCKYGKKDILHNVISSSDYDLNIFGIRKAEGGTRASAYRSCFDERLDGCDEYRPIFWYRNETKEKYNTHYKICNSECYTQYGLKRTGCAGCPFGRDFEYELQIIEKYEPKLFNAVNNIFGDSYEYTRKYKQFCKEMNEKQRMNKYSN